MVEAGDLLGEACELLLLLLDRREVLGEVVLDAVGVPDQCAVQGVPQRRGGERDPKDAARGPPAGAGDRADEPMDLLGAGGPEELGDDLLLGAARSRRLAREGRTGEDRTDGQAEPLEAVLLKALLRR